MNPFDPAQGAESVYNFWLSLVPQLVKQVGSGADKMPPPTMPWMNALQFPADPIAAMAQMTQQSLQMLANATAPMMGAAAWPGMLAPSAGHPAGTTSTGKTIDQAWSEFGAKLGLPTNDEVGAAFERTYGALGDALGLGPARRLQAAWQDLLKAAATQQDARASYALVVASALAKGQERLLKVLAEKANAGERVERVLVFLKLWALCTEEAMHETLQSQRGLAATAALTRASLGYYRAVQKTADIVADMFGLATRRELDEAFREIQALKRKLRGARRRGEAA